MLILMMITKMQRKIYRKGKPYAYLLKPFPGSAIEFICSGRCRNNSFCPKEALEHLAVAIDAWSRLVAFSMQLSRHHNKANCLV